MISAGLLQPGSRLPPERELAKQFGVNRASIRQALKALDVMGVVHQRVGDGTYLTQDASSTLRAPIDFLILVDGISFQELYEARRIVEPELAALAAKRRTEEDLQELETSLDVLRTEPNLSGVELAAEDLRFHEIIWRIAGNRVCQRMFASLQLALTRGLNVVSRMKDERFPLDGHQAIYEAIRAGDAERARKVMFDHLKVCEGTLLKAGAQAPARAERETVEV